MRQEAKCLVGKHDFRSFMASDPYLGPQKMQSKSCIRTISRLDIKKSKEYIYIEIESNGFLYKMVRNIVGTLLAIGRGRYAKGIMAQILKGRNRALAKETAAAHGLCLIKVIY